MASNSPCANIASLASSGWTCATWSGQTLATSIANRFAIATRESWSFAVENTVIKKVCFLATGSSFVLMGVAARNVAARVLSTHRHQTAHPGLDDVGSPDTHDARLSESARSPWGSGAVGVFSIAHAPMVVFFAPLSHATAHNKVERYQ